jgi:GDP-mannose 4,6-dehydratase
VRALITGITGFVGSHLAEYILENHTEVEIAGFVRWRSPKVNIEAVLDRVTLYYGNLLDLPSIQKALAEYKPDVIFHLAAQSYVDFSFIAPIDTIETNISGTCNLLEAVKQLQQLDSYNPVIHICSSSEVYGQVTEDEVPIKENNPLRPASPYAVSKIGEDMLALQYWSSWKIKTIRSRMFTHTGPRRGEVFVVSNFARQVAMIEAELTEPVVKVGNLDSVRTFSDVRDAVRAYWLLVNKCQPGEVYNIGGVETMTVGQMLDQLLAMSKVKNIEVEVDPARLRPSDVTLQIPCVDKFYKATGWKPRIKFEETLKDTLDYWRDYYKKKQKVGQDQRVEPAIL